MSKSGSDDDQFPHAPRDEANTKKRILITTIGSRGEVQPVLGLALELKASGHWPVLCVPPTFKSWVESLGIECAPIGVDTQKISQRIAGIKQSRISFAKIQQLVRASVIDQFAVTAAAARGCELIVTAGDLQHAARSIAESLQLPYVHATYCPVTLKSPDHAPLNLKSVNRLNTLPKWSNRLCWMASDWHWNALYRDVVNEQRAKLELPPARHVPSYIATDRPWLAVDPVLAPTPRTKNMETLHTGAWFLEDKRPLPTLLEEFLAAGEPPLYFGFGSMQARSHTSRTLIEAARALGRRAIISQGWANLEVIDASSDCIAIGDVSHELLFPRVACIVHHGGAGTVTAAARAGTPQVIVPHMYDQFYWANRVQQLGIGVAAGKPVQLKVDKLMYALRCCLKSEMAIRAQALAIRVEVRGARIAAERLVREFT